MTVFWKARIGATPNSVGNVRARNPSRSVKAEWSEVEDHGEETQRNFKVRNERSVNFSIGTLRHMEIRKKRGPSQVVTQRWA